MRTNFSPQPEVAMGEPGANVASKSCSSHCNSNHTADTAVPVQTGPSKTRHADVSSSNHESYLASRVFLCHCSPEYQFSCGRMSTIWDVSEAALGALCSERVSFLARHKTTVPGYLRHRSSTPFSIGLHVYLLSMIFNTCCGET